MIMFNSDYMEGCAPSILEKIKEINMEQNVGYEEDDYCKKAADSIKAACGKDDLDVHFLVGGTQTNFTVIASALRPYQGVFASDQGHINVHETGAIEATGHKVITLPNKNGKISAEQINEYMENYLADASKEHVVMPGMVYISSPTELGTIYSRSEILNLRHVCDKYNLYLYLDGARLSYGLASRENDVDMKFLADILDIFYIGGTKVGALFGEAVVINNPELKTNFRYMMKQKGGLLAKGFLLGVEFMELFKDDLYFKLGEHAITMANELEMGIEKLGFKFLEKPVTNQLFVIMPNDILNKLKDNYGYEVWGRIDDKNTAIRLCTSWATKKENIDRFLLDLKGDIS
ncbi:MAG: threonine aldolase family protein [Suipraeoptans sp.]